MVRKVIEHHRTPRSVGWSSFSVLGGCGALNVPSVPGLIRFRLAEGCLRPGMVEAGHMPHGRARSSQASCHVAEPGEWSRWGCGHCAAAAGPLEACSPLALAKSWSTLGICPDITRGQYNRQVQCRPCWLCGLVPHQLMSIITYSAPSSSTV